MFDVQKLREEPSRSTSSEFVEYLRGVIAEVPRTHECILNNHIIK